MTQMFRMLVIAAAALSAPGSAAAAGDAPTNLIANKEISREIPTTDYVTKATYADAFEIESSRLAAEKASDPKIKEFARKMVDEHHSAADRIKAALPGGEASLQPPAGMGEQHKAALERLRGASGTDFDRMYMREQEKSHRTALALHRGYAKSGENAELRKAAAEIAQITEAHMTQLDAIRKSDATHDK